MSGLRVAGIDFSTKAVDVVTIAYGDENPAEAPSWQRVEFLFRGDEGVRWLAACQRAGMIRRQIDWSDIDVAVLEYPAGVNHQMLTLFGALASQIPHNHVRVTWLTPAEWRKTWLDHGGLKTDEAKRRAQSKAVAAGFPGDWASDAYDALGLAMAWRIRSLEDEAAGLARRLAQEHINA